MKKIIFTFLLIIPFIVKAYNYEELNIGDYLPNGSELTYTNDENMLSSKTIYYYEKNEDISYTQTINNYETINIEYSNLTTGWKVCDIDELSIKLCNSEAPNYDTIEDPYSTHEETNPYTKDNILTLSILLVSSLFMIIVLFIKTKRLQ